MPTPSTHEPLALGMWNELTLLLVPTRLNRTLAPNFSVCAPFTHARSLTKLCVGMSRALLAVSASKLSMLRKLTCELCCNPTMSSLIVVRP